MSIHFRLLTLAFVLAVVVGGSYPSVTTATAPYPPCANQPGGCANLDPVASGCLAYDGKTLMSAPIDTDTGVTIGQVDLEWSQTCQTKWSKVTKSSGGTVLAIMHGWTGSSYTVLFRSSGTGTVTRSAMYYGPNVVVRACGKIDDTRDCTYGVLTDSPTQAALPSE